MIKFYEEGYCELMIIYSTIFYPIVLIFVPYTQKVCNYISLFFLSLLCNSLLSSSSYLVNVLLFIYLYIYGYTYSYLFSSMYFDNGITLLKVALISRGMSKLLSLGCI